MTKTTPAKQKEKKSPKNNTPMKSTKNVTTEAESKKTPEPVAMEIEATPEPISTVSNKMMEKEVPKESVVEKISEPVQGTVTMYDGDNLVMRLHVEDNGGPTKLGRTLVSLMLNNKDLPMRFFAPIVCATLSQAKDCNVSIVQSSPLSPSTLHLEYQLHKDVTDDEGNTTWRISVRSSKRHTDLSLETFCTYCKTRIDCNRTGLILNQLSSAIEKKKTNVVRRLTGYQCFGNHTRQGIIARCAEKPAPKDVMSMVAKAWSALSQEEKDHWNEKASEIDATTRSVE
eukprot:6211836-Pleurochrysis_carterae.AAC.3